MGDFETVLSTGDADFCADLCGGICAGKVWSAGLLLERSRSSRCNLQSACGVGVARCAGFGKKGRDLPVRGRERPGVSDDHGSGSDRSLSGRRAVSLSGHGLDDRSRNQLEVNRNAATSTGTLCDRLHADSCVGWQIAFVATRTTVLSYPLS